MENPFLFFLTFRSHFRREREKSLEGNKTPKKEQDVAIQLTSFEVKYNKNQKLGRAFKGC